MSLYGLALIPSDEVLDRVIDFRFKAGEQDWVSGPMLGLSSNLPHVTVLQCPLSLEVLTEDLLCEVLSVSGVLGDGCRGRFMGLYEQNPGWCFMGVEASSECGDLQRVALSALEGKILLDEVIWDGSEVLWSESERFNYSSWGYRYMGNDFVPHVTLGRFDGIRPLARGIVPSKGLLTLFDEELAGIEFNFSRAVFYRAGEFGVLHSIVAEVAL